MFQYMPKCCVKSASLLDVVARVRLQKRAVDSGFSASTDVTTKC